MRAYEYEFPRMSLLGSSLANRSNAACHSHTSTVRQPPSEVGPHTWISSPSGRPLRSNAFSNCSYCSRVTPGNSIKTPTAIGASAFLLATPHEVDSIVTMAANTKAVKGAGIREELFSDFR